MPYRECRTAEAGIGMLYYLSDTEGTGGRLKTEPEDFVVREISDRPDPKDNGRYVIADVTCRNWETNRLVRMMSRNLGISREKIGFAGTKDKRAITTQLMSFECSLKTMEKLNLDDITVSNMYLGKRAIQIGDLIGNKFIIRVKDCDTDPDKTKEIINAVIRNLKEAGGFPNYFGVQRFGTIRPVTHKVGELIVRGDMEGAVRCYLSSPSAFEEDDVICARQELSDRTDWSELLKIMPDSLSFEKVMVSHLADNPNDWTGAIECLPKNLQMMFTHAYQSYLFNLMLSKRMECGMSLTSPEPGDVVIPTDRNGIPLHERSVTATTANIDLVARQIDMGRAFITGTLFGSGSSLSGGRMSEIESKIIEKEGIESKDFIVPRLNHCSSKGSRRELLCPLKEISCDVVEDGYTVSFSLPKGNYATCLMREFMKSEMNRY